jgi:hypothetical protein
LEPRIDARHPFRKYRGEALGHTVGGKKLAKEPEQQRATIDSIMERSFVYVQASNCAFEWGHFASLEE